MQPIDKSTEGALRPDYYAHPQGFNCTENRTEIEDWDTSQNANRESRSMSIGLTAIRNISTSFEERGETKPGPKYF